MGRIMSSYTIVQPPVPCDFEETAQTFLGNAEIKARGLYSMLRRAANLYTCKSKGSKTTAELELDKKFGREFTHPLHPVLADDSGLVIPALGGRPGIYSARYGSDEAGRELSAEEKNQLVLSQMESITDRRCYFVAALVVVLDEERILSVQERFEGVIAQEPMGNGGFGYDPIVYLPELGRSVAELTETEKDTISHRGLAGAAMQRILKNYDIKEKLWHS